MKLIFTGQRYKGGIDADLIELVEEGDLHASELQPRR